MKNAYVTPQNSTNESGEQRRIGFELEFGELELDAAAIVAEVFSGSIEKRTEMEIKVKCEKYDAFTVELDWQLGKRIAEKRAGKSLPSREGYVPLFRTARVQRSGMHVFGACLLEPPMV